MPWFTSMVNRVKKERKQKKTSLEMSDYLPPINRELSIEQKREMFSIRNRMLDIPYNFPGKKTNLTNVNAAKQKTCHTSIIVKC
jgi:hypothetical protein